MTARCGAGALTLRRLWADADANGDAILDAGEAEAYGAFLARGMQVTTDGAPVSLAYVPGTLAMKSTLRDFQSYLVGSWGWLASPEDFRW